MKKEKRSITFKDIEVRSSNNEGKKTVEGIIPYDSRSVEMYGTIEVIDKSAFNKTLMDGSEIRALWNHNDNCVLGSTKSGTLQLENSNAGLIARCELPNTTYAADLFEIINRGDVKTMSFGFTPVKWEDSNGGKLRTLKEVKLHEVSFGVIFPAYPDTTSVTHLRKLQELNIDAEKLNEALEKDSLDDNDKLIVKQTIDSLRNILGDEKAAEAEPPVGTQKKVDTLSTPAEDCSGILLQIEAELA